MHALKCPFTASCAEGKCASSHHGESFDRHCERLATPCELSYSLRGKLIPDVIEVMPKENLMEAIREGEALQQLFTNLPLDTSEITDELAYRVRARRVLSAFRAYVVNRERVAMLRVCTRKY
jgi:hypothetical protein